MKVSIIVPAYNEASVLAACLESIQAQSVPADEVIVVDNNSSDATAEIASRFPVKIVKESKQGLSFARNTGFNLAKGDVLARIDADTILPASWVARVKQQFEKPIVGLTGPIVLTSFLGSQLPVKLLRQLHTLVYFNMTRMITGYNFLLGCNMVLRAETWDKIKESVWSRDDLYHEDADLSIHAQPFGEILFDEKLFAYISPRRFYTAGALLDYPTRHMRGVYQARKALSFQTQSADKA